MLRRCSKPAFLEKLSRTLLFYTETQTSKGIIQKLHMHCFPQPHTESITAGLSVHYSSLIGYRKCRTTAPLSSLFTPSVSAFCSKYRSKVNTRIFFVNSMHSHSVIKGFSFLFTFSPPFAPFVVKHCRAKKKNYNNMLICRDIYLMQKQIAEHFGICS